MRRLLSIAAVAAVGLAPLIAQSQMRGMGGGGARGGGHVSAPARGAVAVRSGPVVAPHVATGVVGVRVASPAVVGARVVTPSGVVVARRPIVVNRFHHPFFFHGCFNGFCGNRFFFPGFGFGFGTGFGLGFGVPSYPYYGYGAPYYPYDYPAPAQYYPSDYNTMAAPQTTSQENPNDVYLAAMLQKLTDEVEAMKNDQKGHAGSAVVLGPKADTEAAVTFVFHDGTRVTTHNYAIAGQTIWIFGENQARKFRLADLDRAATEQANAAHGIELHLPEPAPAH